MTHIQIKRVYEAPEATPGDGYRIFVDRLWPRGESKEKFHYDLWAKDISPSTELREWYHADEANRWDEFVTRYIKELEDSSAANALKKEIAKYPMVTLLYASRDTVHNNAVVLERFLQS